VRSFVFNSLGTTNDFNFDASAKPRKIASLPNAVSGNFPNQ
jgi:hypothetical protein